MADFRFLRIPGTKKWVILDPNRAKRPNVGHRPEKVCPFCIGREKTEEEVYRVGGEKFDTNWRIRVVTNIFPFTPFHEIVVHSPDHHKNFEELPLSQIELILQAYRNRYRWLSKEGQVYIFHNRGLGGGESLPHPHSQVTVIPHGVEMDIPPLDVGIYKKFQISNFKFQISNIKAQNSPKRQQLLRTAATLRTHFSNLTSLLNKKNTTEDISSEEFVETENFLIFCPLYSQWSDEVWIAPVREGMCFGDISNKEISDLGFCLQRLIAIFDMRHGHEFPFNFYIYPGKNWYLRIIPRIKILGGFEVGTGIVVNTQDPGATFEFIKEHFFEPDLYKIRIAQQADYWKSV